jgi:hypothetical protein
MRCVPVIALYSLTASHASAIAQAPTREWALSPAPALTMDDDGTPMRTFNGVRGAWRLSGERVAVADRAARQLRVFGARGEFLYAFGRDGGGPSEFRTLSWVWHAGDTAYVYDGSLRRITAVHLAQSEAAQVLDLRVTAESERGLSVAGRLTDGRWLVHAQDPPNMRAGPGLQRLVGHVGFLPPRADGAVEWVADHPDMSIVIRQPPASNPRMTTIMVAPFASSVSFTTNGNAVWYGDGATDSLTRLDALTRRRLTAKLPWAPRPVTDAVVEAARAEVVQRARSQSERDMAADMFSAANLPRTLPTFEEFIPGTSGELWVRRFEPSDATPATYAVISARGTVVARVNVPAAFRITDVGADYVVGVAKDVDGVESVRVYQLKR